MAFDDPSLTPVEELRPAGVAALYERERTPMLRVAVLMVASPELAEEVVHDAFVAVQARWETLDRPGAYLRTTVINRCREVLRRRDIERRHQPQLADLGSGDAVPSHLHELQAALSHLSERQRAVVVLRYLLDVPDAEIAESLGCRQGTVRTLARRALTSLRKELS